MINQKTIDEIRDIIVETYQPEKIILFGSYANGNPTEDSDLDLLVIKDSNLPRYKRGLKVRLALSRFHFAKDILFYTPEEINRWTNVPCSFVGTAMNQGETIYER
ncbi:nucleotidyltransferase domain-containing protein [Candidatus Poribacteria bacterium]|nr:nucleotidyltransferase domain-containing protein [Candidatus Poribacteria bacterium]